MRTQLAVRGSQGRLRAGCLALALALVSVCAAAQDAAIPWSSLSTEQRSILADTEAHWDQLDPKQQRRLQGTAERWAGMSEEQRSKTRARMERWKAMPPEQRKALRDHARRLRELPPEQRQRLHQFRKEFRALPQDTQTQFRDCLRRKRNGEAQQQDCRDVWPQALREKYADLPESLLKPQRPRKLQQEQPAAPVD